MAVQSGLEATLNHGEYTRLFQARGRASTLPRGAILATTPEGVATLDIVYEVRTFGDA